MQIQNFIFIFAIVSLGTMLLFAPVEAVNKPLSEQAFQRNRKRCINISWINIVVAVAIVLLGTGVNFIIMMYYTGAFVASISVLIAHWGRKIT